MIGQIRKLQERQRRLVGSATAVRVSAEISHLEAGIRTLDTDLEQIQERIDHRQTTEDGNAEKSTNGVGNRKMPGESQRDFLIRTGKITPFSKIPIRHQGGQDTGLQDALLDAEDGDMEMQEEPDRSPARESLSHRNLMQPGFADGAELESDDDENILPQRRKKRRRIQRSSSPQVSIKLEDGTQDKHVSSASGDNDESGSDHKVGGQDYMSDSSEILRDTSDHSASDSSDFQTVPRRKQGTNLDRRKNDKLDMAGVDDGNERLYKQRLKAWVTRRSGVRAKSQGKRRSSEEPETHDANTNQDEASTESDAAEEQHMQHPSIPDTSFDNGFRIPGDIYPSLFDYQKTGVRWLWELYSQKVGGIVGDEMGLGKTIQVIAFLAGLQYSRKLTKPVLIVAPATVMKQWVNEFHTWWPPFRVSILHSSGSGMIDLGREAEEEDSLLSQLPDPAGRKPLTGAKKSAQRIVERVKQEGHILVTTYSGLQTYADLLIPTTWEYAVLDEGHKIRNPNIAITIYCKELRTPNRIILSGTPMQNNLVELWSLFDFIFPMRLGTLVNFRQQFEFPIRHGGYANATNLQVQTALKCAETLKDAISPYLLQRFKADVASDLPKKSEQVLFCKLTKPQREAYENFLASDELRAIMAGKRQVLYGIDILRKICNHPDLQEHKRLSTKAGYNYGNSTKSGKMQVVKALLELWRDQGHRTLLFAQHRIMLDILEKFIRSLTGFNYRRMDGTTPIHTRQGLVDEFNSNPDAHVFLLTTKVGGLGINLTGADRVIIFDPDWNPSTDVQARERAWRLGQKREVMIYRLMTAGTIEEKIYHRQLFKQFLINKILRDPKQRQTFQMKDLHDLFTLGGADEITTETGAMFQGMEARVNGNSGPDDALNSKRGTAPATASRTTESADHAAVRTLTGVASLERFAGEEEEESKAVSGDAVNSEARVMETIFARSGVQTTLEHDQIVNGKRKVAADPQMIEQEAKRVAALAAKELKKAGEAARNVPVGTPTWTGQFGVAGRPDEKPRGFGGRGRGGPASSRILAGLQQRQATGGGSSLVPRSSTPDSGSVTPKGTDFMKMIRDFLTTHGGQAHTQMLIDHFNRYCSTPERTAEFKAMLTEIATLQKGSRGRGRWVLNDEYRA